MRIIVTILFFVFFGFSSEAQIKFYKVYSDNGNDFGESIVQLADSSYTVVGRSSSFGYGPSQAFMMHLDSLGNRKWAKSFGGLETDGAKKVLHLENEGYWVSGFTNSFGENDYDFYLFKTDESGELEWEKNYGGTGWERVHDAAFTKDTNIVMVGETSSNDLGDQQIYIVKTNQFGDTAWTKSVGITGEDYATSIEPISDTTFAISGVKSVQDSVDAKAFIMYMHEDGTIYWEKTYGDHGRYWLNEIHLFNGAIVGVGGTNSVISNGDDTYRIKVDLDGNIEDQSAFAADGDEYYFGFTKYGAINQFFVAKYVLNQWSYPGGNDIDINRLTTDFGWIGNCPLSHANPDYFGEIIPTSDGSVILVGTKTGFVSGGNDVFVMKVEGDFNCPDPLVDVDIEGVVNVDVVENEEWLSIGPVPFSEELKISTNSKTSIDYEIRDVQGRLIQSGNVLQEVRLDTRDWPESFYFIQFTLENGKIVSKKLVK